MLWLKSLKMKANPDDSWLPFSMIEVLCKFYRQWDLLATTVVPDRFGGRLEILLSIAQPGTMAPECRYRTGRHSVSWTPERERRLSQHPGRRRWDRLRSVSRGVD